MGYNDRTSSRFALGVVALLVMACSDGTGPTPPGVPNEPIAVARMGPLGATWEIVRINPDGSGEMTLTSSTNADRFPAWSPDYSQILYVSGNSIWLMKADGSGQRLALQPEPGFGFQVSEPSWAPDQQSFVFGGSSQLVRVRLDGTNTRVLGEGDAPSWSRDGQRIAFSSNGGISVMDADGSNRRPVVAPGLDPAWSPDGKQIAFAAGDYGETFIYSVDADGTNKRQLTTPMIDSPKTTDLSPAWSSDGRWIAFQRDYALCTGETRSCSQRYDVFIVRADGTDLRQVTKDGGSVRPSW